MRHGLDRLGQGVVVELGKARYSGGTESFEWDHAWVRHSKGLYVIDGNIDVLQENPFIADGINPLPFWGPFDQLPNDRLFSIERILPPEKDDVELDADLIRRWKLELDNRIGQRKK